MKSINKLVRFTGVLIVVLIALVSAQTDTFQIYGKIIGDVVSSIITATPQGSSRGGGSKIISGQFFIDKLSWGWTGKIHLAAQAGGFSYTPQDTIIKNVIKRVNLTFVARDTAPPIANIISPLPQATFTVGQTDTIRISASDNSRLLKSIRLDFSTDGIIWDSIKYDTNLTALYVYPDPRAYINYRWPITPSKICGVGKIRVILKDYFQGLQDTAIVTIKVNGSTQIRKGNNHAIIVPPYSKEIFDLAGRKITRSNKISKCYVKAGLARTWITLR